MKRNNNPEPPECLTLRVDEAAIILGISLSAAYTLVEESYRTGSNFVVLKIGRSYRILKESFYDYLYQKKGA